MFTNMCYSSLYLDSNSYIYGGLLCDVNWKIDIFLGIEYFNKL